MQQTTKFCSVSWKGITTLKRFGRTENDSKPIYAMQKRAIHLVTGIGAYAMIRAHDRLIWGGRYNNTVRATGFVCCCTQLLGANTVAILSCS